MSHSRLVALPCRISRGVVPDERAFEITLSTGEPHASVAPVHYFWDRRGARLTGDGPRGDQETDGLIAARFLERQDGVALVSIPDGSVVTVDAEAIGDRPSAVVFDVEAPSGPPRSGSPPASSPSLRSP